MVTKLKEFFKFKSVQEMSGREANLHNIKMMKYAKLVWFLLFLWNLLDVAVMSNNASTYLRVTDYFFVILATIFYGYYSGKVKKLIVSQACLDAIDELLDKYKKEQQEKLRKETTTSA